MFLLFELGVFTMAKAIKEIYRSGTINKVFKPIDLAAGYLGEIEDSEGNTYNFKMKDFELSIINRLEQNSDLGRIDGWEVDFAADNKGNIIIGSIAQRKLSRSYKS